VHVNEADELLADMDERPAASKHRRQASREKFVHVNEAAELLEEASLMSAGAQPMKPFLDQENPEPAHHVRTHTRAHNFAGEMFKRPGAPMHVMRCRLGAWLVLVSAVAFAGISYSTWFERPVPTASQTAHTVNFKCLVLGLNSSDLPAGSSMCKPFLGTRFSEEEFKLVSADGQRKLQHPELQERASEFSNNASVNIFMNHLRMWKAINASADDEPVLILEDDAALPPDLPAVLGGLLENLRKDGVSNYIVKLHDLSGSWRLAEWLVAYDMTHYRVRSCRCRPHTNSASTAAYLIDRQAARVLLEAAFPLSMHVDVYLHEMGCVSRRVNLYTFVPNLVHTSHRPSTHFSHFTLQRLYLLIVEIVENFLFADCYHLSLSTLSHTLCATCEPRVFAVVLVVFILGCFCAQRGCLIYDKFIDKEPYVAVAMEEGACAT